MKLKMNYGLFFMLVVCINEGAQASTPALRRSAATLYPTLYRGAYAGSNFAPAASYSTSSFQPQYRQFSTDQIQNFATNRELISKYSNQKGFFTTYPIRTSEYYADGSNWDKTEHKDGLVITDFYDKEEPRMNKTSFVGRILTFKGSHRVVDSKKIDGVWYTTYIVNGAVESIKPGSMKIREAEAWLLEDSSVKNTMLDNEEPVNEESVSDHYSSNNSTSLNRTKTYNDDGSFEEIRNRDNGIIETRYVDKNDKVTRIDKHAPGSSRAISMDIQGDGRWSTTRKVNNVPVSIETNSLDDGESFFAGIVQMTKDDEWLLEDSSVKKPEVQKTFSMFSWMNPFQKRSFSTSAYDERNNVVFNDQGRDADGNLEELD